MNLYLIYNPHTGKYIAIDENSGGYPYETEWYRAKFWTSIDEASNYKNMFHSPKNIYNANYWTLVEVFVSFKSAANI